jgi:hypothetical protein
VFTGDTSRARHLFCFQGGEDGVGVRAGLVEGAGLSGGELACRL